MKNLNLDNNHEILKHIATIENMAGLQNFDTHPSEEFKVNIRVDERIGPAKFKPDPLIPGGYMANSLTVRAMKPDIFLLGNSLEDLSQMHECVCGVTLDLQFWKLCPHCARDFKV